MVTFSLTLVRAIYFGAYDTAKAMVENPNFATKFAIAQAVAAGSVTVAYPFDTVRRRLMMMSGEGEKMYKARRYFLDRLCDAGFHLSRLCIAGHHGLLDEDCPG